MEPDRKAVSSTESTRRELSGTTLPSRAADAMETTEFRLSRCMR